MKRGAPGSFGAHLRALRETAGFTQEELATIAGLSVHAVSALERGERRRPHLETVRALSAALDLKSDARDALIASARAPAHDTAVDELNAASLPLAFTSLLGRAHDVELLQQWLTDPTSRIITLVGPGGVGKTRLALEIGHTIAAEGTTRVAFVPLAYTRDPAFVAAAIAEALGLPNVRAVDLPKRARVACADRPTLLVLDNFEQVLDAAPLIADLLTSVASLRVLATSRAPLHLRGEREYHVEPLALEGEEYGSSPADFARSPAVRLFVERVRDIQPDFRLTSGSGPILTAICRRLDALPLALELAAPWMKVLNAEDLLRQLREGVLLPTLSRRDLPARQQTMNATVAWSYQLLDSRGQRAFRRLAPLSGRFTIDAAEAVLASPHESAATGEDVLGAVAGLIDKSLLRVEPSVATRPLYQMLETVRAYAALELTATGERDEALEGLVRYCSREASLAAEGLFGPAQLEWLNRVRDDLESYRVALTWLIGLDRTAQACDIAWGLMLFWLIRGQAAEGLKWYQRMLTLPSLSRAAEARMLYGEALMWYTQGELGHARPPLNRALALAQDAGDVEIVVQVENMLGHVEHALGNLDAARDRFTRSANGFRALAIPWGIGNALTGMAAVALATGDGDQAECLLAEATSVLRHAGPLFLSLALYPRATLAVRRGNPDQAIALVRESLTHIRELHDKFAFVYALVPLAAAAVLKGDDAFAARIVGARDAVTESTGTTVVDRSVRDLRERAEREARARLGPHRWREAYSAGRRSSIDALLNDIDSALSETEYKIR